MHEMIAMSIRDSFTTSTYSNEWCAQSSSSIFNFNLISRTCPERLTDFEWHEQFIHILKIRFTRQPTPAVDLNFSTQINFATSTSMMEARHRNYFMPHGEHFSLHTSMPCTLHAINCKLFACTQLNKLRWRWILMSRRWPTWNGAFEFCTKPYIHFPFLPRNPKENRCKLLTVFVIMNYTACLDKTTRPKLIHLI